MHLHLSSLKRQPRQGHTLIMTRNHKTFSSHNTHHHSCVHDERACNGLVAARQPC